MCRHKMIKIKLSKTKMKKAVANVSLKLITFKVNKIIRRMINST